MRKDKLMVVGFIAVVLLFVIGVFYITKDGKIGQTMSHLKSSFIGLDRTIEVYNYGVVEPVKSYKSQTQIEYPSSGTVRFLDNGKTVNITGGLVISIEQ